MSDFVHLHIHSEFSLLDGANRIKDLPVRAKELGMKAMAITDHGVMYGVIDFYKACKKEGIKPIIGCEVYVASRTRFDKEAQDKKYYHLILLAKNNKGYQNLSKLVSLGFTEGYYYKPRIDLEILEKYHEGIICLSGCLAGAVSQAILNGNIEEAENVAKWHHNVFGEDYYLEIQNNGVKEQVMVNQKIIQIARRLNIPIVATNDAHYLKKEDAYNHEVLLCIQTGKRITDEDRMRFETDELYVKSPEEMSEYFKNFPDAIENTVKIAEKCNVEFEFGHTILPNYDVPEEYATHYDYFKKLCDDGIKKRYGENPSQEILDRAAYELKIISQMGYVDYYLIVWDYINYAKSVGIPVGPGRGSGAGSILAYAIGITDIDPMKYNLLFERFLNPERISMPDFDVDFCYERRGEVIDYVERKYGKDHVSQIITFGTMSARMVIRDVGRALDMPYAECDKLAKMIPNELHITIKKAMEQNKELRDLYESDDEIHKMLDIAMALEGMPRQASTHACGIVITKEPVDTYVPLYVRDGQISTQFIMTTLEELGLLKMDFLGLRTLTVIQDAIDLVKENRGIDVEFDKDMNDPKVYKLWQNGESIGIFQFESQGMTNFMKELKPDCLEDIIAGVSLYRPGPMDQIPRYISNKKNPDNAEYTHPSLIPILNVTYGCMVYQEQVMQIVRDLAGYSLGRADLVRRAMGKKKLDVMAKEREYFIHGQADENGNVVIKGCIRNGIDEASANKIFDEMAEFAKYAFNKSHAAAYAVVSYRTAYLKAYYPEEFMAATLNSFLGNLDKIPMYIDECKRLNIDILKPDINKSFTKFTVDNGKIRFGLGSVKNVGIAAVNAIVKEREENGNYESFTDFCERMKNEAVNKKCIESLIRAGAFDQFEQTRATLLASFESILDTIQDTSRKSFAGQVTMFDLAAPEDNVNELKYSFNEQKEFSEKDLLSMEKEMLGIYISGHPLEKLREQIERETNVNSMKLNELANLQSTVLDEGEFIARKNEYKDGQFVKYAGIITNVKKKYTKNNTIMAFVTVEDLYGTVEIIVFENCYQEASKYLVEESIVMVEGRLSIREDDEPKIVARTIKPFGDNTQKILTIDINGMDELQKDKLRGLIRFFHGERNNMPVQIMEDGDIKPCGGIYLTDEILKEFEETVGKERIEI
ncbi:MAG: DNA polymerase III subunit alpha [Clostridia bacterium]|jgi:DNA polymerase-3 subunit alpha|nr:DNA polymerase III subunit alpha [Clostridium sp.]MEE0268596.1 DNA polymerase III subunit alpha [Clostridia bacterium]